MTDTQSSTSGLQLRSGPLITGAALIGGGVMLALAGLAVGGAHLLAATRRWVDEMEVPPSELARLKWAQAKAGEVVVKGDGITPLYVQLTQKEKNPKLNGEIAWNFTKFLVGRNGEVVNRFEPRTKPEAPEVVSAIESELSKK